MGGGGGGGGIKARKGGGGEGASRQQNLLSMLESICCFLKVFFSPSPCRLSTSSMFDLWMM